MNWRLILDSHCDGPTNMAVDEAIMRAHATGVVPPTLRLYGWRPPALSLGYTQKAEKEIDFQACRRAGIDVVRRPTGGRAVLHEHEVTYSVVIALELLPGTVAETYRQLSVGLVDGLRALGLPAQVQADPPRAGARTAACFDSPSWYELVVGGKKVVGSAQVRRDGVLLQHGSILMDFNARRVASFLRLPDEESRDRVARGLEQHAAGLKHFGCTASFPEVAIAVAGGFGRGLGVKLVPGHLTEGERETAAYLRQHKYGTDIWTLTGKTSESGVSTTEEGAACTT